MKERPILFSGPMVRAILDGRKSMTRRVIKPQPDKEHDGEPYWYIGGWRALAVSGDKQRTTQRRNPLQCPYGHPGDMLWVKEGLVRMDTGTGVYAPIAAYRVDETIVTVPHREIPGCAAISWMWGKNYLPSIHMPRKASRITLEITNVRVERLQEITEEDAIKEGIELKGWKIWRPPDEEIPYTRRDHFEALWDSINGKTHPWLSDPWVWVIEFKRQEADHD